MAEEVVHKGVDPLAVVLFCWSFGCLLGMRNAESMKSRMVSAALWPVHLPLYDLRPADRI